MDKQLKKQFVNITKCKPSEADYFLENSNWNLENALDLYYKHNNIIIENDFVEDQKRELIEKNNSPMKPIRTQLIENSIQTSNKRVRNEAFRDFKSEQSLVEGILFEFF